MALKIFEIDSTLRGCEGQIWDRVNGYRRNKGMTASRNSWSIHRWDFGVLCLVFFRLCLGFSFQDISFAPKKLFVCELLDSFCASPKQGILWILKNGTAQVVEEWVAREGGRYGSVSWIGKDWKSSNKHPKKIPEFYSGCLLSWHRIHRGWDLPRVTVANWRLIGRCHPGGHHPRPPL